MRNPTLADSTRAVSQYQNLPPHLRAQIEAHPFVTGKGLPAGVPAMQPHAAMQLLGAHGIDAEHQLRNTPLGSLARAS